MSWYYRKLNELKYKPFLGLTNYTSNVCNYLTNGNSMVIDMFMEDLKKHSNLVHPCPFQVWFKSIIPHLNSTEQILVAVLIWWSLCNAWCRNEMWQGHCFVRNLTSNLKRFPAIIPSGAYYIWLIFFTKINDTDHTILNVKLFADVKTIRWTNC